MQEFDARHRSIDKLRIAVVLRHRNGEAETWTQAVAARKNSVLHGAGKTAWAALSIDVEKRVAHCRLDSAVKLHWMTPHGVSRRKRQL